MDRDDAFQDIGHSIYLITANRSLCALDGDTLDRDDHSQNFIDPLALGRRDSQRAKDLAVDGPWRWLNQKVGRWLLGNNVSNERQKILAVKRRLGH